MLTGPITKRFKSFFILTQRLIFSCYDEKITSGALLLIDSNHISSGSAFDPERQRAFSKIEVMLIRLGAKESEHDIVQEKQNI